MALQGSYFGRREPEALTPRQQPGSSSSPVASTAAHAASAGAASSANAASTSGTAVVSAGAENESKLTVGPNIKLKGVEITDCDTLVVEGSVEATMDSRVIQISERGAFKGSAEIDIAEIRGAFDGNLTVREKLVIYATGKVTGKIRYGKVVIEEGGQLSGEITFGAAAVGNSNGSSRAMAAIKPDYALSA